MNPQELLAGYVLGDLDAQEAAALEQLLASQPELWADIETLQATLEVGLPQRLPPLAVRERIVSRPRPWLAVCLAIIAALSISNAYIWRRLQLQHQPQFVIVMTAPEAPSSRVALAVNPDALAATLVAENLPPLAPGEVYALWTVLDPDAPFTTDELGAILTAVFAVDQTGSARLELRLPPAVQADEWLRFFAVTPEAEAAPHRHQGSPIVISQEI